MTRRLIIQGASSPVWLAALGAVLLHGAATAADLNVCIDKFSATAARDHSIAHAVAERAGLTLATYEFDGASDDDGLNGASFKALLAHDCHLILGFPLDATDGVAPAGLMATRPYDQTGFVLVVPKGSPAHSLSDLPQGTEVAVTYETTPDLYFADHPNLQPDMHRTDVDTLNTLSSGAVHAAMVWGPTASSYNDGASEGNRLAVYPLAEPHARWNVVGLYLPQGAHEAATFEATVAVLERGKARPADVKMPALLQHPWHDPAIQLAALTTEAPGQGPPALYTDAQAKSGAAKFSDNCETCHGAHLEGRAGPALKGPNFASAKSAFNVSDIFNIVSQNMPASNPGSLDHVDYVEIMAFLLQQNGYPAGTTALTFEDAGASKVPLVYRGK